MAKLKRGKSKRLVLDLGSSAVRLCELTPTKAGYQLTKYYQREFPIDPSMEEDAQREARKTTILALLKEAKVRPKKTVFGVPGQSVFTRTRTLPPVPEYKVTQIVRYEIQQQIPFQLDQIAYDYQVLQRTEAGGYDVLMAAIKVDVVEKRLETIKDIKRQVDIVDVCPLAAYNWLKFTKEFGEAGECVALIDLGASTTDIVIERDNQFRFTRSLNLGGNDVTSAIAAEFGMAWPQAEKLKREKGFAPTGDPARDGKGGEVIGRVLNRLVSEINRSFAYFRSQPGGGPVNRIIVTGGGACLRNMIPYLQRQLGIEVRIAQPLAGLAIAPGAQEVNEHPEQAATAMGLALRCCEQVSIGINLIPPRILESARRREAGVYWLLSVATLVLIMLTIVPAMAQQNKLVQDKIEIAKREIATFDPALPFQPGPPTGWNSPFETQLNAQMSEIQGYIQRVTMLDERLKNRRQWLNDLLAVNDARPRGKLLLINRMETSFVAPPGNAPGAPAGVGAPRGGGGGGGTPSALSQFAQSQGIGQGGPAGTADDDSFEYTPSQTEISQPDLWSSSGFEGIVSVSGGATTGDSLVASAEAPVPWAYNGFIITGFAQDIPTIEEFKQNLETCGRFVVNGSPMVYFDQRFTDPKPFEILDNAGQMAGAQVGGGGGFAAGGSDDDDDDRRRRGGGRMQNLATANANSAVGLNLAGSQWGAYGTILSFRIDLQFRGDLTAMPGQLAGTAPAGRGSASMRMRDRKAD
ncbi:MAG: type IV pilus assembly protein PilM [Candidatus Hydrogenedentes bacterium]|nr:type IV pilus assembly protein PilM [Candidatus Hydrogenedentota bacterium]